jgi:hypothetical protein
VAIRLDTTAVVILKGKESFCVYGILFVSRCDQCKTEIGMYDKEEVYHFFNVVASHT